MGPGGEETDWLGHAYEMFKLERDQRLQKGGTLNFVAGLLDKLAPGNFSESALHATFSQIHDWHHRDCPESCGTAPTPTSLAAAGAPTTEGAL